MQTPRQNRVNPFGELHADPSRGAFMGNRGILHDADGALGKARWRHKNWIICKTEFKGRQRTIMAPNRYTELFFLDEVTAFGAGHRPCAECRRSAYLDFRAAVDRKGGISSNVPASELDARLHDERALARRFQQRRWRAELNTLPPGTMIEDHGCCFLVAERVLLEWSFQGYRHVVRKSDFGSDMVTVLTPETNVLAFAGGYVPAVHPTAFSVAKSEELTGLASLEVAEQT